jgi:hypothetical protein
MFTIKAVPYPSQSGPSDPTSMSGPTNPPTLRGEQRVYLNAPDPFHEQSKSLLRTLHAISAAINIDNVEIPHFIKYEALS